MNRLHLPLLLILVSILTINCQREISGELPGAPGNNGNPAPLTATLQGKIVDETGQPVSGVTVKVGSKVTVTDGDGYFRITKASLDKNSSFVTAEKAGYFKAYRSFRATTAANHVNIKLIKKVLAGTVSSSTGGDVTLANGTKISLPADGFVKYFGGTHSGTVNVYAAYIDPTAADIDIAVPGSFMADDKNGTRVTLKSYGMLAVDLESTTGERLQLAAGKTATLTAPIPASILSSAPNAIPMWFVDEQTGIWKEEGSAIKTGNNYVGEVKHFTFWNYDISIPAITLTMTLKNPDGVPLVHAFVKLTRSNGYSASGVTDSLGTVSGLVPANEVLQMQVLDQCYSPVYTQNVGPFAANTNLGVITVTPLLSSSVTIQGTVVNCSGAPIAGAEVIVDFDYPRHISTNANGQFSVCILSCSSSPTTCDIIAIDNVAMQQGTVSGLTIVTPVTNAGTIPACGTSSLQFINYTFNGTNYSLSTAVPGDSIFGYSSQQGATPYYTSMFGYNGISNKSVNLAFQSPTASTGTYNLSSFGAQGVNGGPIQAPSTITITNFPTVGGFFEGSFSGSFKDSTNTTITHTLSGTFRVRRN